MKRDIVGYGRHVIPVQWPNKARLALNFVVNYEEGAELSPVNGDQYAETYGGEFTLAAKPQGMRNLSMESLFEYGSRTGIWRLMRLFDQNNIPVTFFITGYALTLNPVFCDYLRETNHEIAGHGWRWIDYATIPKEEERKHIQNCIQTIQKLTGKDVNGWYSGRRSEHTRQLLREIGGFIYDSDSYSDDLPYFEHDHLIIPYTLDCNDFRFTTSPGFSMANDFLTHLKYAFTYLYEEKRPALMTIGLHSRISGHPGRCMAIKHFIEFIKTFSNVWIARRIDIAHHWLSQNNSPQ
ncbi:polysaccharide deacetylase family protein [Legionella oakridgensis]|uniref:polysaccharide deacetylase family protein n=1 Tax=Legionella oakridgensis TaxID=29423 RepID=UPI0003DDFD2C|nr:polysaccharide deacetylase family protein [Legionella oakridgensis]ETO94149.1 putative xylanase/chitin deacetylase [Legionella oakridgensis RV-2-2007]